MQHHAKLPAVWFAVTLAWSARAGAQPEVTSETAAAQGDQTAPESRVAARPSVQPAEVTISLPSTPSPEFETGLVTSLAARLRSAGFSMTLTPSRPVQDHAEYGGTSELEARGRALSEQLQSRPEASLGVIVQVTQTACYVALVDVRGHTVTVRQLPRVGASDDAVTEEIVNVVVSAAGGTREMSPQQRLSPAEAAPRPKATLEPSNPAPATTATANTPPPTAALADAESVPNTVGSAVAPGLTARAGVHVQTAGSHELSLGPRLSVELASPVSDWLFAGSAAYHPAHEIVSDAGDFELSRYFFAVGGGHVWRPARAFRIGVSLSAATGRVGRERAQPGDGVTATPATAFWRFGGEFATHLEARFATGASLGVSLGLGAWTRVIRFASAQGTTLFAEEPIFASGTFWVGYSFDQ